MAGSLSFERVETGRTHTVTGAGVQQITDADGNPEAEYVLYADIDGAKVRLQAWPAGAIDQAAQRARDAQEQESAQAPAGAAAQQTAPTTQTPQPGTTAPPQGG